MQSDALKAELLIWLNHAPSMYRTHAYGWAAKEIERLASALISCPERLPDSVCEDYELPQGSRWCHLATVALTKFC